MRTFILDGFLGNHRRWEGLRKRIEETTGHAEIWSYDNSGRTPISDLGAQLAAHVGGAPVCLAGYSMGGLVIRAAVLQAPGLDVRRAAILHTPHRGTLAAWMLRRPGCRDMRPGSRFLQALENQEWNIPTLATWCASDLMVIPGHSARWKAATVLRHCLTPAHAWPVVSPGIHDAVCRFFRADTRGPA